jgi:hypothetical protein
LIVDVQNYFLQARRDFANTDTTITTPKLLKEECFETFFEMYKTTLPIQQKFLHPKIEFFFKRKKTLHCKKNIDQTFKTHSKIIGNLIFL